MRSILSVKIIIYEKREHNKRKCTSEQRKEKRKIIQIKDVIKTSTALWMLYVCTRHEIAAKNTPSFSNGKARSLDMA